MNSSLSGKVLLIIIAVITSAGGFTLGYFVGQNAAVPPHSILPGPQVNDVPSTTNLQSPNNETKAEASAPEPPSRQDPSADRKQAAATPVSHEVSMHTPAAGKQDEKTDAVNATSDQDPASSDQSGIAAPIKKKTAYTVQVGSFKRQKDADTLKHKLEAKGYKVSVKKEAISKGAAIYKVRVGEFERKKEAAVAALKLNKTEGLKAFAALKKQ